MIGIFSVLLFYNVFEENVIRITVTKPTQTDFKQLQQSFNSSLTCPCSNIAFKMESFAQINSLFHQVCSSAFVQSEWIKSIIGDGNWSNIPTNEFNKRGFLYFTSLQTFCRMAVTRMNDSIRSNLLGDIVNGEIMSETQLRSQINLELDSRLSYTIMTFVSQVEITTGMGQLNGILNIHSSNWIFSSLYNLDAPYTRIPVQPVVHGANCSCATSSECNEPVFQSGQKVPGFVLSCNPMETFLQFSLICLYNQTCLEIINIGNLPNLYPLNVTLPSRFLPNTSIEAIVNNMFLEEWTLNISYSKYYEQCQPLSCSYLVYQRTDLIQIIAVMLGLYGGLRAILRLVVPLLVNVFSRIMDFIMGRNKISITPTS